MSGRENFAPIFEKLDGSFPMEKFQFLICTFFGQGGGRKEQFGEAKSGAKKILAVIAAR